jgi:phosphoglycolate phosphatase
MNKQVSASFDLVMFDLDGTLIETAPEICDAVNDTLKHFGLAQVQQDQVDRWIGHGTRELLVQALAQVRRLTVEEVRRCDDLPLIAAEFDRHYQRRCGTRSHLYPHVREVLQTLRGQGVRLAVVTNKEARYTRTVLAAHDLEPMFDRVSAVTPCPPRNPIRPVSRAAWRSSKWTARARFSSATRRSTWPARAMPACRSGRCPMATTWASLSRPASPTA